jgi:gliding motility-associated-like protein
MKKFLKTLFFFQLSTQLLYAQAPAIDWQKCYGSGNYDNASSIATTSDGGSIFVGITYGDGGDVSGHHGSNNTVGDFWVVKLDKDGNIQWSKCIGGNIYEQGMSIRQASDGSYLVAGRSNSPAGDGDLTVAGQGGSDFWVVRLSATGSILWQQRVGGEADDYLTCFQPTPDGGTILGGWTISVSGQVSGNHGGGDGWIVKLDGSGSIQWQRCLGGSGNDQINAIQVAPGGYIAVGYTNSSNGDVSGNHGQTDAWAVRLDNTGNIQWSVSLGGSQDDAANDVQLTSDGGYLLAGYTYSNDGQVSGNHGQQDFWAVKLDNSGTLVWQQCYGGGSIDQALSVAADPDGGFVLAGQVLSTDGQVTCPTPSSSGWLIKISATGALLWEKVLGGIKDDVLASVQLTADNAILVCGGTLSTDLPRYHTDISSVIQGDAFVARLSGVTAPPPVYTLSLSPAPANICSGSRVTFTTTTNIIPAPFYEWIRDGARMPVQTPDYTADDFRAGEQIYARVIYTDFCGAKALPLSSNIVTMDISPIKRPVVSISASTTPFCEGGPIAFTAAVTGGNGMPVYQWLVNGNPAGTGGTAFSPATLANGDVVSCSYSDNTACVVPGGDLSNAVAASVFPVVDPSISITTLNTKVCQGDPTGFIAKPVNGGTVPGYQWMINGAPAGTNTASFSTSTLADGDVVSCQLNSTAACATSAAVPSNLIPITVMPETIPSLVIDYATPVCSGQPVLFKARTGTVVNPTYTWQLNDAAAGSQDSYTATSLADGDKISCTLSDASSCSRPVTVSVVPVVYPTPVVSHVAPRLLIKGQSIMLALPVSGNISTYDWSPSAGLSDAAIANPLTTPLRSTNYRLDVVSTEGCSASGDIQVNVTSRIAVPGAFTPNNDGHNDIFYVIGGPVGSVVKDMVIYDRWDRCVFQVHGVAPDDPAFGWDGRISGQTASPGTYVYEIRMGFADGTQQVLKGTVVLVR